MANPSGDSGRIAVDAMGSDLGPSEIVEAVRLALHEFPGLNPVVLVGQQEVLRPLLAESGLDRNPAISVLHASEIITMEDKPLQAVRRKKDASMLRAIELVKNDEAGIVVSCGNTGSLMAGGALKLRTMEGVDRPALAAVIPRENGHFILIDAGANPDAKPEHLAHNAILGSHYCRVVLGTTTPRVGLLTIGTEEGKGNVLITEAHEHLKKINGLINYAGPIEGFQVFEDHVDVVVCDGFVGNICLKSWESLAGFVSAILKNELRAGPLRMLGATLSRGAFGALKRRINPERYGGAPLLGLKGDILKAHGSSNRHAIKNAIHAASQILKADMNHRIETDIARANELLHQPVA